MSYNGSGTFSLVAGNPVVTGTTISSTWANNTLNDIATGLSTAITKDGQTTPTANIPMGGYKITNLAAATLASDAPRYDQVVAVGAVTTITSLAGLTAINGGQIAGTRRKNINGDFSINQRNLTSPQTLAAGERGHDGWKAGASGCTYSWSTTANLTTVTITAGTLIQTLEGIKYQSGTHVISWTGTAQGKLNGSSFGATGVTATLTGGTNADMEFNTGTLALVQCELGSTATSYEYSNNELSQCQRYLPAYSGTDADLGLFSGLAYSTTLAEIVAPFQVQTRIAPTGITVSGATDFRIYSSAGGGIASTAAAFARAGNKFGAVTITVAGGLVAGDSTIGYGAPTGTPSLLFTGAEL